MNKIENSQQTLWVNNPQFVWKFFSGTQTNLDAVPPFPGHCAMAGMACELFIFVV